MHTEKSAGGQRLLLVDDDVAVQDALAEALELRGFQVTAAEDGEAALELLRSGVAPDAIVLDLAMPRLDGWGFRVQQRREPTWKRIPTVVVSSDATAQAAAVDADAFLQKPVDVDALTRCLVKVIESARHEHLAQTEKMASLGLLAAGVAHEISNPIAYTIGNVQFAREQLESLPRGNEGTWVSASVMSELLRALDEATEGATRVRSLVREMQTLGRIGPGAKREVDLRTVAQLAIRMTQYAVRGTAEVLVELAPVPPVEADESKLVQVLINLLVNAAQALGDASTKDARITVRTGTDGLGRCFVEVEDNGPGIPPALLERIFEPFFTTKRPGVGTGLGLSICQNIARQHGGELAVRSELGKGSCFQLRLPIATHEDA
jgi:signal transduction histidine kinase